MKNIKIKFYSLLMLIAMILMLVVWQIDQVIIERHVTESRNSVHDTLAGVTASLTFNLYKNIQVVKGLPAMFSVNPSLPEEKFGLAVQNLFDEHTQLRNIAAAPGLVIKYMYPIKGNEAAIGVDFRSLPLQIDTVMQAKESRKVVLAGPLTLVQGGEGIIARSPVFIQDADGKESFWGVISAVIDVDLLYQRSGLLDPKLPIELALRGKDGFGKEGEIFFGNPTVFDDFNIKRTIELPTGSWQIVARPVGGWEAMPNDILVKRFFLFSLTLLVFSAIFAFLKVSMSAATANQRFKNLLENSPIAYALNNTQEEITFLNKAFVANFGYTLEDIPTLKDWWEKAYPDPEYSEKLRHEWASYVEQVASSEKGVVPLEVTICCKDGSKRIALVSITENKQTSMGEFPVILYDITERKQAEKLASEREEQLSSFYRLGLVGLAITSPEKGWVRINQRLCEMLEYSEDQLRSMTWAELTHPEDLDADEELFTHLLAGEIENYSLEKRFISQSGKIIPTNLVVSCVRKSDGQVDYVTAMVQDITVQKQSQMEVLESEKRLQLSQSAAGIGTWEADFITNKEVWSDAITDQLGFPDIEGPTWDDFINTIHPDDREHVISSVNRHIENGSPLNIEYRIIDTSGAIRWMNSIGQADFDAAGNPIKMRGTVQDITARRMAEEKMRLATRVFNETNEGILVTDAQKNIIDVNPAFSMVTGYKREELMGQNPRVLSSGQQSPAFYEKMWDGINTDGYWRGEIWNRNKSGDANAELLSISALKDDDNKIVNYVGIFTDITESKKQQEKLSLMAHYDVLTKLPNRALFIDRFNQAIAHSMRTKHRLAVCFLDLDNFKLINDNYGHDVGDAVLKEVANRISLNIREEDTVSRQGGDEFTLLLNDVELIAESILTLERIHDALADPYSVDGVQHYIKASSGVTFYPDDKGDIDTLLRHADQAMYKAKLSGKNCYRVYNAEEDQRVIEKHHQISEIERALENDELTLYFQPKVNMRTGEVFGVEALIRWIHPEKGLIPPLKFLPTIEGADLEIKIGDWVIDQALKQLSLWAKKGLCLEVSVNISSKHLLSASFIEKLAETLNQYEDLDTQLLQIEILESSALGNTKMISDIIESCQSKFGVSVALDDFGTGYSSLTHLRSLPVDMVKVDQSFVRDMIDDPDDYAIIDGVIGLAETFNRQVIAEGVETIEHGLLLLLMGCELAQGYAIAKPMPAKELGHWVDNYTPIQEWVSCAEQHYSIKDTRKEFMRIVGGQWLNRVELKLKALPESEMTWPILDVEKCHCGSWFKKEQQERLFSTALVSELDQGHKEMHKMVDALVLKYTRGEVLVSDNEISELEGVFFKLIDALEKMK